MYSAKFVWNCPHCDALNTYCPDPKSLSEVVQDFSEDRSGVNTGMKLICHYCNSQFIAYFDASLNIENMTVLSEVENSHIFTATHTNRFYEEPIQEFVDQNNFNITYVIIPIYTEYPSYVVFHLQGDDEFNYSSALHGDMKSNLTSFGSTISS